MQERDAYITVSEFHAYHSVEHTHSPEQLYALLCYLDKKAYEAEIARCQKTH
jgi:hypothetical protein